MMNELKRERRKEMRQVLSEIPAEQWAEKSLELSSRLVDWLNENPEIKRVALFSALPTEVNLQVATLLLPSIEWHYPVVKGQEVSFHRVNDDQTLKAGYEGILEPNPQVHPPVPNQSLDLIICPGLAFTQSGRRMGRGGGFYDRFLATVPETPRLGVCLPEQLVSDLPMESHDIEMTHLLLSAGVKKLTSTNGAQA